MPELKLGKLPDRMPVKLSITITPDLHRMLQQYAALYAEAYGREESVAELIPAMLTAFLDADRSFQKNRVGRKDV